MNALSVEAIPAGGESGVRANAPLKLPAAVGWGLFAVACFHLAFQEPRLAFLVVGYLAGVFELRRLASVRQAFYSGLVVGLGVYVPPMEFLWTIFGPAALPLWLILALFHAAFLAMLQRIQTLAGSLWALLWAPVLWCGVEYLRSEVWWLKFTWFAAGTVFQNGPQTVLSTWGVYGVGMLSGWVAGGFLLLLESARRVQGIGLLAGAGVLGGISFLRPLPSAEMRPVRVAGVQLEAPGVPEVTMALKELARAEPRAELVQLSEYTFDGEVPAPIRDWCRREKKWLVAGGRQAIGVASGGGADRGEHRPLERGAAGSGERFYNTAFVVSPEGEVVFSQAKSRPIQFFKDGEPAPHQRLWESPWGRLGIAICYDASYRRVMDELVRAGAEGLLVPTMDLETWGEAQHRLNARMSRLRVLEYGVPLFRVASSGISQVLNERGELLASAPFPGPGARLAAELPLRRGGGRVPWDSVLAPLCLLVTAAVFIVLIGLSSYSSFHFRRRASAASDASSARLPS